MAVTKLWKINTNLNTCIDYISDERKTDDRKFVTGINCNSEYAKEEMKIVKESFDKSEGILAFHGYQSFKENEVTPEIAHEIGIRLANEMWGDKYQVLVATHINTKHIHNHFVVNSVSFMDGSKFNSCRSTLAQLRYLNDSLCSEYGLSTLEEKETPKSKMIYTYYLNSDKEYKNNYYEITKKDIDSFIRRSNSYAEFISMLRNNNYEVTNRYGKLSVRNMKYKRNIRIERYFGEEYSIENIKQRIIEEKDSFSLINEEYIPLNTFNYKKKSKSTGFIALCRYYCYLLKIYPTKYNKYPEILSEDIEQLEIYNNINKFLDKYNIQSDNDFYSTYSRISDNYNKNYQLRRKLRNEYKRNPNDEILEQIKNINSELKIADKELIVCFNIENNTEHISKNIEKLENIRKEKDKNESIK